MATSKERAVVVVSVVIPAHNAALHLDECLESVAGQSGWHRLIDEIEISVYNDGSVDGTAEILARWERRINMISSGGGEVEWPGVSMVVGGERRSRGAGYARNRAVAQSKGTFLCTVDADDVCEPGRVAAQMEACLDQGPSGLIVGSRFVRFPDPNAARHYTAWCNGLTQDQLMLQQYREVTIIQPTWFMHRTVFEAVGGYDEEDAAMTAREDREPLPDDLLFFHRHLDAPSARLFCVKRPLVRYRHHGVESGSNVSARISRKTLLRVRLRAFERRVLSLNKWKTFSIWGAGRDGKNFLTALNPTFQQRVRAFCDVDPRKVDRGEYYNPDLRLRVPIVHFTAVEAPFVCCVALGRTEGAFERNVASIARARGLVEGVDFYFFN